MSMKGLLAVTLSLGLSTVAMAVPNLIGPTGLLYTPTAQAMTEDGFNVSLSTTEGADNLAYAFNYGARPNLEVGFTRMTDKETIINAKYAFIPETTRRAGVAIGVMDLTNQENTTVYAVASKRFSPGELYKVDNFQAHLGLAAGDGTVSLPLNGLFGGLTFDVANAVTLIAEHDGTSFNYGARAKIGHGIVLQAGVVGEDHQLALGASYNGQF